jgi:hypothetical protein
MPSRDVDETVNARTGDASPPARQQKQATVQIDLHHMMTSTMMSMY